MHRSGVIPSSVQIALYNDFLEVMVDLAKKQQRKTIHDQPTHVFLCKLLSLIESNRVTILPKGNLVPYAAERTMIGYEDDTYYFLYSDLAHREVKKLCAEQGESFSISENGLLKALADEMLSLHDRDGRTKKTVRIGTKTQRLLCLHKLMCRRLLGRFERWKKTAVLS